MFFFNFVFKIRIQVFSPHKNTVRSLEERCTNQDHQTNSVFSFNFSIDFSFDYSMSRNSNYYAAIAVSSMVQSTRTLSQVKIHSSFLSVFFFNCQICNLREFERRWKCKKKPIDQIEMRRIKFELPPEFKPKVHRKTSIFFIPVRRRFLSVDFTFFVVFASHRKTILHGTIVSDD